MSQFDWTWFYEVIIHNSVFQLCFLTQEFKIPPTHHSFTFNLRFLNELKHKARFSKNVCWIFHFRFRFVYIFAQQKAWTLYLWNVTIHFKIKITEKQHTFLLPDPWVLITTRSLRDSNRIRTYNRLVCKRTLNDLAKLASLDKWLSVRLRTKWLWVQIPLLSLKL